MSRSRDEARRVAEAARVDLFPPSAFSTPPNLRRRRAQQLASSPLLKETLANQRRGIATDATIVGAAVPQSTDEFGAESGIDLTQVGTQTSPSIVQVQGARARLRSALAGPSIGGDDTTVPLASQIRSPLDLSSIPGTPPSRSLLRRRSSATNTALSTKITLP